MRKQERKAPSKKTRLFIQLVTVSNSKLNTFFFSVDGKWSGWKAWGTCTKSCGGGLQTSSRTCTNPPPTNGGEECGGENERSRDCNPQPCPSKLNDRFILRHKKMLGYWYTDMQLILLELIHSSRHSIRKARESFLINLAGTLAPHAMNPKTCYLRRPVFLVSL